MNSISPSTRKRLTKNPGSHSKGKDDTDKGFSLSLWNICLIALFFLCGLVVGGFIDSISMSSRMSRRDVAASEERIQEVKTHIQSQNQVPQNMQLLQERVTEKGKENVALPQPPSLPLRQDFNYQSPLNEMKPAVLYADDNNYAEIPYTVNSQDLLITAWIRLDAKEKHDNNIRTILSNKGTGCDAHQEGLYGIAISVNGWGKNDHKIYVELGDDNNGCYKLSSEHISLKQNRWYHIGVALHRSGNIEIYIDGMLANHHLMPPYRADVLRPFTIGRYSSGMFPFYGSIGYVGFVHMIGTSNPSASQLVNSTSMSIETQQMTNHLRQASICHFKKSICSQQEQQFLSGTSTISILSSSGVRQRMELFALYPLTDMIFTDTVKSHKKVKIRPKVVTEVVKKLYGRYFSRSISSSSDGLQTIPFSLATGLPISDISQRILSKKRSIERKKSIKESMKYVWNNYEKYAWGKDELKPLSQRGHNNWGGLGFTLVDSLDTLWLMDMKDEFWRARNWVRDYLRFDRTSGVSMFETTIRELGGLLAAYDLSRDEAFLEKAKDLGGRLATAFTAKTGIATSSVNLRGAKIGQRSNNYGVGVATLSELGSLQIEFRYLAQASGDINFEKESMRALQLLHKRMPSNGLYPIKINIHDGSNADTLVTLGALGDSFYEYLLKLWLQGNRKEIWLRDMYDTFVNGAIKYLLCRSSPSSLAYFGDWRVGSQRSGGQKMDHLVCFMPGVLALGAYTDPDGLDSPRAQRDLELAKALMYTCYEMYHRMPSGISGEYVEFRGKNDFIVPHHVHFYILRPETAESLFVLHQLTGDSIYADWAWNIWQSINKHCKKGVGYAALRNVMKPQDGVDDRMESFFLGETIKYLYLAQDLDKKVDLMKVVLNTEAHVMSNLNKDHNPVKP